jgi:hypothetical protein
MDVWTIAAEQRYAKLNEIKTNVHNIKVCKPKDLPTQEKPRLNLSGKTGKHLETGICVMLHTTSGTVLEVRGVDENQDEFSYKFHLLKGKEQPITMRAVGMSGQVNKLKVSLADETHSDKHMSIHDAGNSTVQKSSDNKTRQE